MSMISIATLHPNNQVHINVHDLHCYIRSQHSGTYQCPWSPLLHYIPTIRYISMSMISIATLHPNNQVHINVHDLHCYIRSQHSGTYQCPWSPLLHYIPTIRYISMSMISIATLDPNIQVHINVRDLHCYIRSQHSGTYQCPWSPLLHYIPTIRYISMSMISIATLHPNNQVHINVHDLHCYIRSQHSGTYQCPWSPLLHYIPTIRYISMSMISIATLDPNIQVHINVRDLHCYIRSQHSGKYCWVSARKT